MSSGLLSVVFLAAVSAGHPGSHASTPCALAAATRTPVRGLLTWAGCPTRPADSADSADDDDDSDERSSSGSRARAAAWMPPQALASPAVSHPWGEHFAAASHFGPVPLIYTLCTLLL